MAEGILFVLQWQQPIHWYVNQPFADAADVGFKDPDASSDWLKNFSLQSDLH